MLVFRWRARDIDGDVFRRAKSSAAPENGPPRHEASASRYGSHLPFQVFCCESGSHVVDPEQSYYKGLKYRHGTNFFNGTKEDAVIDWDRSQPCQDSTQAWFCRDLWVEAARDSTRNERVGGGKGNAAPWDAINKPGNGEEDNVNTQPKGGAEQSGEEEVAKPAPKLAKRAPAAEAVGAPNEDAKAGSDADAMPEGAAEEALPETDDYPEIPNAYFKPARILMNPRCVTTYAGVSHSQLALDLFGDGDDDSPETNTDARRYILDDWEGAPSSFACQEQRQTGGRKAVKTQRRQSFAIHKELLKSESQSA
jgi:hypothetical protein